MIIRNAPGGTPIASANSQECPVRALGLVEDPSRWLVLVVGKIRHHEGIGLRHGLSRKGWLVEFGR